MTEDSAALAAIMARLNVFIGRAATFPTPSGTKVTGTLSEYRLGEEDGGNVRVKFRECDDWYEGLRHAVGPVAASARRPAPDRTRRHVIKDIEVVVCDSENLCEEARVKQGYVSDDHVAMALVRAVNAACTQLGITPPGELFARAAEQPPRPEPTRVQAHIARAQIETINRTLTELGYTGEGPLGVIDVIAKLEGQARVARALGPDFVAALRLARDGYPSAEAVGRALDARESPGQPKVVEHSQLSALRNAVDLLGQLLNQLRNIEPEPVRNDDGSTTVTLTEAVEIGTPGVAP